ncbi:MAG: sigma-70 family RNA polymerase sigma factor [Bacteroidales bacterium]|nr:sigma-70 family RNA polymerase sigma factor [Bacteroidales bacterium]
MEKLNAMSDQQLVALYLAGDNEAFDCLLFRHKDRLFNYIYYRVHNADLADDLFQETFTKVLYSLHEGRYTETGQFYAWLTRVAHNLIIDTFRQEERADLSYQEEYKCDLFYQSQLADSYQEAELINEQTLTDVRRLMNHLPEEQKQVVFMRFYQDMPFKEIADATGVSINTSLGRMRYALLNMRRMAQEHGISLEAV